MITFLVLFILLGVPLSQRFQISNIGPEENGLIETLELFLLTLGGLLWLPIFISEPHWSIRVFVANICLVGAGREISWLKVYGVSERAVDIAKAGHLVVLVACLLWVGAFWMRKDTRLRHLFQQIWAGKRGHWLILGFVLILSGDAFEKGLFESSSHVFWEEWLEMMGYLAILLAGVLPSWAISESCPPILCHVEQDG
ncbi:hypothetical protein [Sedimentitalea sp.]|uniref:hypothetical protein n=1 Tax=Sedimentitalea sp. TaxID=2048915 RepID=UPI0032982AC5